MSESKFPGSNQEMNSNQIDWSIYKNGDDLRKKLTEVLRFAEMEIPSECSKDEALEIIKNYFKRAGYAFPITSAAVSEKDGNGQRTISVSTLSCVSHQPISFLN